jgi:hypothetical protein
VVRTVVVPRVIDGGFVFGGGVVHPPFYTHLILGGYVVGGPVVRSVVVPHLVAGGFVVGGPVVRSVVVPHLVAGGFVVGGSVSHVFGVSELVLGGVMVGGSVVHVFTPARTVTGGVVFGGAVVHSPGYTDPTSGGFELGGAAGDVFTPGDVLPGNSCADAGLASLETLYSYPGIAMTEYWWKVPVTAGVTYYFSTPDFGMTTTCLIFVGGSCPFPNSQDFSVPVLNCRQFVAQATGYFYCKWNLFFGTTTIKWRLSTVGCL